jgi:diacylglycerol kinase family enzyme
MKVVSVLEAIDCVSAEGTQNKSDAQFFFKTTGIETQIITRVLFKRQAELTSFEYTVSQLQEEEHHRLCRTKKEVPT